LHEKRYAWNSQTTGLAAQGDHYDCLKYAIDNGCPIPETIYLNSIQALQLFEDQGLEWNFNTCQNATKQGNLEVLKWALEKGAPVGEANAPYSISSPGIVDCLKYMMDNGALIEQPVYFVASVEILKYFVEHIGISVLDPEIYTRAAEIMQRDTIEYLISLDVPRPASLAITAAETGNVEFLKWCVEEKKFTAEPVDYGEGFLPDILFAALFAKNLDCVKYVVENNLGPKTNLC
jgi:hypothetical protein